VPGSLRGEQTGGEAIHGAQVGCTLASAIKDQQLMADQRGFGNHGTETRPCQSDHLPDPDLERQLLGDADLDHKHCGWPVRFSPVI
jgi:hypothetical protein